MTRRQPAGVRTSPVWFVLALGVLPLSPACYYKLEGAFDPFACDPACSGGELCYHGRCVVLEAGAEDGPLSDGVQPDGASDGAQPDGASDGAQPDGASDAGLDDTLPADGPVDKGPGDGPAPDTEPPDQGPVLLYQEDFANPAGFVDDGKGTWLQQNGVLMQTSCATTEAVIPGVSWSNIAATARLRSDSQCTGYSRQAGLIVRVASFGACVDDDYYVCAVDFNDNYVYICRLKNSCACSVMVQKSTGAMKDNTWYWMEFSAAGTTLSCSLWGGGGLSPVSINHTDSAPDALTAGTVGFVASGVEVSFDDLTVVQK